MDALTVDEFKQALPDKMKKSVNAELIAKMNSTLSDPEMYETYRENMLSYANVMQDGRFKLSGYIDAVKYVSLKLAGKTNTAAFEITFPAKVKDWDARGVEKKDQASYITAFNKSKMVTLIMEQSMIPSWVLNQDLYQKALNTQAELMMFAKSEKVRSDAANSILTHAKMPETQKVTLDITQKPDSSINALRDATMELVAQQKATVLAGLQTAEDIAHSPVIIDNGEDL